MNTNKTKDELERDQLMRETLEAAAKKVEALSGSHAYEYAWKRAAREIRDMKP
jgi:hypothetical protein